MKETQQEKRATDAADSPDQSKRQTLARLAVGAAFVAPLVTSVSMKGLTISKVHAGSASSSGFNGGENGGKNGGHNGGHNGGKNGGKNGGMNGGKNGGYNGGTGPA